MRNQQRACARGHSQRSSSARLRTCQAVRCDVGPSSSAPASVSAAASVHSSSAAAADFSAAGSAFGFGLGYGYGYGYCDPFWGCPAGLYGSYYNGGYYGNQIYNADHRRKQRLQRI